MLRFLTMLFAIIVLLGSMLIIGLLGIGKFSGGDGFLRSCRYYNNPQKENDCFWFWEQTNKDLYPDF